MSDTSYRSRLKVYFHSVSELERKIKFENTLGLSINLTARSQLTGSTPDFFGVYHGEYVEEEDPIQNLPINFVLRCCP